MSDYQEMLAGTAPDDPDSRLVFRNIQPNSGSQPAGRESGAPTSIRVQWQCAPGKNYQLYFIPDLMAEQELTPMGGIVTAAEGQYEMDMLVDLPAGANTGAFRVKLITESPSE